MKRIVTLTLNPTIDGSASAEKVLPIRKIRTTDERYHPGGGGINVARVIQALGGEALAIYLAGGPTGAILADLLGSAGLASQCIPISGYTRIAHTVFERSSGQEYRFVPEGPQVSVDEWERCLAALDALDFDYVVASGTLPRGMAADAYRRVSEIAHDKTARFILDTSGPALRETLGQGVFMIKPNLGELEALVGQSLPDSAAQLAASRDLVASGAAQIVAVTLGADGAFVVSKDEAWRIATPPIEAHSAVGAGDSFVGAMTLAFAQGRDLKTALAYGTAAGTAAVLSPGAELSRPDDVARLYADLAANLMQLN